MVLSKATQKAVCQSAPGVMFGKAEKSAKGKKSVKGNQSDEASGSDESGSEDEDYVGDNEEEEEDDESTGSINEFATSTNVKTDVLGVDVLIATPERLHHLIESQELSLSQ
jgi:ATP-dependent RNA helicase DDX52/ROK1